MREKILEYLKNSNTFVSGEDLCKMLGLSRTAVWKHIKKLREEGYNILSSTNKGYFLESVPDALNLIQIKSFLKTTQIGKHIKFFDSIDSTNLYAKKAALEGAVNGLAIISTEQTDGKGRLGRKWESCKGTGIYLSIVLKPEEIVENIKLITLGASLAVCDALTKHSIKEMYIKWPNDILIDDKKVCGILTEGEMAGELGYFNYIVVGIGVNVYQTIHDFSTEIKQKASSLANSTDNKININLLCADIMNCLEKRYIEILNGNIDKLLSDYRNKLGILGQKIRFILNNKKTEGIVKDIDNEGQLIVYKNDNSLVFLSSGEITLTECYISPQNT